MADKHSTLETSVPERPAIPDVLHEHIEEIGFLSIQRRKLLFSNEIPLRRFRAHTERIEAHVDGLRVGGRASLAIAQAMLEGDNPWHIYAAARVWIEQGLPDPAVVQARLQKVTPELRGAWKEVFRQLPADVAQRIFPMSSTELPAPAVLEVAVDAFGWHGLLRSEMASQLARSSAAEVRRAVARQVIDVAVLIQLLNDPDVSVRRCALWSLGLQNPSSALDQSRQLIRSGNPDAFALRIVGLLGQAADGRILVSLLTHKELARPSLLALRDLACPELAEFLLPLAESENPEISSAALKAFESLAGRVSNPRASAPGISPARSHWNEVRKSIEPGSRSLHGQKIPWQGPPADEPMQWVWRKILSAPTAELRWLRREVPDGFFSGGEADEAIPGE